MKNQKLIIAIIAVIIIVGLLLINMPKAAEEASLPMPPSDSVTSE